MLIDTHAHVNFQGFKAETEEVLARALEMNISVINVGTQIDTSRQAVEIAEKYNPSLFPSPHEGRGGGEVGEGTKAGIYAVVGLHPVHTYSQYMDEEETHFKTREEDFDYEAYKKLAQSPKVVGIGECGLDYFRLNLPAGEAGIEPACPAGRDLGLKIEDVKNLQKKAFIKQIQLAKELNKTLVVHSRSSAGSDDACLDIYEILKGLKIKDLGLRFVLHSYTGRWEVLEPFFELGGYVSFNGIITFDKTGNMEKLVKNSPLDRIVLETDCPYLTPVPNRGKRNEPSFVRHTAEHFAKLKGLTLEEVERLTTENAKRLFLI
jgi:TatD DNase family protein